jgi:hypothetical protein
MKRTIHAFMVFVLLISTARAGPEFRVAASLLTLFDSGKKIPVRYNTQTDVNFEEGGSVRVFSTVTPEGMAEVEVLARSKVDFYFLGANVSLAPSGTIRATVENIQHPQIKLTWDGGVASASKVLQTPEQLLSYFIISQPPVFSKSPIADDELSRIYPPESSADRSRQASPDIRDAVEVDFPFATPSPAKSPAENSSQPTATASPQPKPSPSPRSRPSPSQTKSDKALLAQTAPSPPSPLPTPKPVAPHSRQTPEPIAKPAPSPAPDLMPDLPTSDSPSPDTILGGGTTAVFRVRQSAAQPCAQQKQQAATSAPSSETTPILTSLQSDADPVATPAARPNAHPSSIQGLHRAQNLTAQPIDLLDWTGVPIPRAMPAMHAPTAKLVPEFLPIIPGPDPAPHSRRALPSQAVNNKGRPQSAQNIQRPEIVLGGQKEFTQVRRAAPADKDPGQADAATIQRPRENVPGPILLYRQPFVTQGPSPQATPFVISSAIIRKNP